MMGRQTGDQSQFFYLFNLEERIPPRHLLRRINPMVTRVLAELRDKLKPFYSELGRPSIDPELMLRMLIVGYCYGLRSERRLCEEVELHLAYRWFCRLDLEDQVPDHSTFSVNRHGRFRDGDIFRQLFEAVVRACMDAGLVKGEGFAVDASVMEADATARPPTRSTGRNPSAKRARSANSSRVSRINDPNADRTIPKVISPTDPCSAWTAKANKRVQFGYGLNYLIDIENAVIVDVEATPARTYDEVAATKRMIERTEECFQLKPDRLAADTAYGTGNFLGWLVGVGITPHIPVWQRPESEDGTFSRFDFVFDAASNTVTCPSGKRLQQYRYRNCARERSGITKANTRIYRASTFDCRPCPLKSKCCPNVSVRKVTRHVNEDARDYARSLKGTPEFEKSRDERKRVEMRFAHLKTHHRFERMRLRGLSGVRDEFHLAAIVQNLKTLANHIWRPPPNKPAPSMA